MSESEITYYADEQNSIYVTNTRLVIGGTTYPIRNISSFGLRDIRGTAHAYQKAEFFGQELLATEWDRLDAESALYKIKQTKFKRIRIAAIIFALILSMAIALFSGVSFSFIPLIILTAAAYWGCGYLKPTPPAYNEIPAYIIKVNTSGTDTDAIKHINYDEISKINEALGKAMQL